jgi:cobalt-zinc-cadmium efflux system protein
VHSHDHSHGDSGHGHSHSSVPQALNRALVITFVFMIVEFVAGYIANSLALISDAAHMATDVGALMMSLLFYRISRKPRTSQMSFGYHRVEVLGALFSGLVIWVLVGFLVWEAFRRLQAPPPVEGPLVFGVALVGLVANLVSMKALHSTQSHNLNVRAAYLHLLTDCMGSVGAVIAGAVLWWSGWRPIDPIVTLVSAVLMVISSWSLIQESVSVLMEGTPRNVDLDQVRQDLEALPGVKEVHDLHIWTVSSGKLALSVHIISTAGERILQTANLLLQEKYSIQHTTIQVEDPASFDSERCYDCVGH